MHDQRIESDSLGEVAVPAARYWGAQTQRSLEHFAFAPAERMPLPVIHALALIKLAAARVNRAHGLEAGSHEAKWTALDHLSRTMSRYLQEAAGRASGRARSPGVLPVSYMPSLEEPSDEEIERDIRRAFGQAGGMA